MILIDAVLSNINVSKHHTSSSISRSNSRSKIHSVDYKIDDDNAYTTKQPKSIVFNWRTVRFISIDGLMQMSRCVETIA